MKLYRVGSHVLSLNTAEGAGRILILFVYLAFLKTLLYVSILQFTVTWDPTVHTVRESLNTTIACTQLILDQLLPSDKVFGIMTTTVSTQLVGSVQVVVDTYDSGGHYSLLGHFLSLVTFT